MELGIRLGPRKQERLSNFININSYPGIFAFFFPFSLLFFPLAYRFSKTLPKAMLTSARTSVLPLPTFVARLRLGRVLHHSSKELRKRLATAVHPSETSQRCSKLTSRLDPFVYLRARSLSGAARRQPAVSGFQLPWADIGSDGGRKRYGERERLIIVRSVVVA